jgi:hypothetical protein
MTWQAVGENKWLDARLMAPDYEAALQVGTLIYTAHVNEKTDGYGYNGTAIHVYRKGAAATDDWPLNGATYRYSTKAPELEGVPLTPNGAVSDEVWSRLQQEADKGGE